MTDRLLPGFTFATYNIHRCIGHDRRYRPDRTAEVLREIDADVVGLQEVDIASRTEIADLPYLAAVGGYRAIARMPDRRHRFGNALLTRLEVVGERVLELSFGQREKRNLIDVDLKAGGRLIRVIVIHLALTGLERRVQIRRILRAIDEGDNPGRPTVLLGDFNEWRQTSPVLRLLQRKFGSVPREPSFPARLPMLPLDALWVLPQGALREVAVHNTQVARRASDHLPVKGLIAFD